MRDALVGYAEAGALLSRGVAITGNHAQGGILTGSQSNFKGAVQGIYGAFGRCKLPIEGENPMLSAIESGNLVVNYCLLCAW